MKALPGSRRELARGGYAGSIGSPLENCMVISTEMQQLLRERVEKHEELTRCNQHLKALESDPPRRNEMLQHVEHLNARLRKIKSRLRVLRYEVDKIAAIGALFRERAKSMLSPEQFDMIQRAAIVDQKAIEDGVAVPHESGDTEERVS